MTLLYKTLLLTAACVLFAACDKKIDDSIISSGTEMSDEQAQKEKNLDRASYAEILDIVGDNNEIIFDKNVLMIFGKNGCYYCDVLKKDIKKNASAGEILKNDFRTYYINTSYTKVHNLHINGKKAPLKSQEMAFLFSINQTPTLVFLSQNGEVKYILPGYNPRYKELLNQVKATDEAMGQYQKINEMLKEVIDSSVESSDFKADSSDSSLDSKTKSKADSNAKSSDSKANK